ncbi:hypothetical protein ACH4UT_33855 [Streptomyces sp. NPDC020799]|uniref:hypothetical protein n=1 Tax=Streptomyces sp. NPDC020799 TaxID=3365091 RepID=UPI0037B8A3D7
MGHRDAARTTSYRSTAMATVDNAVACLLLTTLTREEIVLALDAAEQVVQRHSRAHRGAELAVERARYEADRAERAFSRVEPENRLAARTLEDRWEKKLTALAEAEARLVRVREARLPLPGRGEIEALAADLPRLWDAPTTSTKDRKRLLRAVISDVILLPDDEFGEARIGVRWHTGATALITTPRSGPPRTPPKAIALARRFGPLLNDQDLADTLNRYGHRTGKVRPYDAKAVRWVRHACKIYAPRTQCLREGELTRRPPRHRRQRRLLLARSRPQ